MDNNPMLLFKEGVSDSMEILDYVTVSTVFEAVFKSLYSIAIPQTDTITLFLAC